MDLFTSDEKIKTVSVLEAAKTLGNGVTRENVHSRIRRGSLEGFKNEGGEWRVPVADLKSILEQAEDCGGCSNSATRYVIVKYHDHDRVEFALCDECAGKAQLAYGRHGGVLEIVTYPLLGEGWKMP